MRFLAFTIAALSIPPSAASSDIAINYTKPVELTISALCHEGVEIKDQWFSYLKKHEMEPQAEITIHQNEDTGSTSVQITYFGRKISILSKDAISSAQNEAKSLAEKTNCASGSKIFQNANGS